MALRVPETNFWDHFSIQTSPQNPQKHTLGTKIGPRKVIFGHFAFFWYFYLIFPWARGKIFKSISTNQKFIPDKKENFSWLFKHLNQRKNTSPLTHFHFYHFQPYLLIVDHGEVSWSFIWAPASSAPSSQECSSGERVLFGKYESAVVVGNLVLVCCLSVDVDGSKQV